MLSGTRQNFLSVIRLEFKSCTKEPAEAQEGNEEGVAKEDVGDDCEADSLDSAIDPDEQRALPPASVSTTSLWQRFLINRWV